MVSGVQSGHSSIQMNTQESQEFVRMRGDFYAAAAHEAQRATAPDVVTEPEVEQANGVCLCCGERRRIPPFTHVCWECFATSGASDDDYKSETKLEVIGCIVQNHNPYPNGGVKQAFPNGRWTR